MFVFERINETTWAYLSSLMMIALFFKFNRFWSIRNLDLLLVILLAPGILMVHVGQQEFSIVSDNFQKLGIGERAADASPDLASRAAEIREIDADSEQNPRELEAVGTEGATKENPREMAQAALDPQTSDADKEKLAGLNRALSSARGLQRFGYYWLFGVGFLLLFRLIFDNSLIRRPLLNSNLTLGGLVFLGCTLMTFLFMNVISSNATPDDVRGVQSVSKWLQRKAAEKDDLDQLLQRGPGYTIFSLLPAISTSGGDVMSSPPEDAEKEPDSYVIGYYVAAAKSLAIASQFAIVIGLVLICYWHFNNFRMGVEAATLYLIIPYTAIYMGHVMHALPAALIVWSVALFKRPLFAGLLIGFAAGVSY